MEPRKLTQRIEAEFKAQWKLEERGVANEVAQVANEFASRGQGRSTPHLAAVAKVYENALMRARDLFLATVKTIVEAENVESAPHLHQAVVSLLNTEIGRLGSMMNLEIRHRGTSMGFANAGDAPTVTSTLDVILTTASTEVSSVFPMARDVDPKNENGQDREISRRDSKMPRVFISHSSKDVDVASVLVELFLAALDLRSADIRCTSVPGCKLQGGDDTDETIRDELLAASVVVGLISAQSFESPYVLSELGASWGTRKDLVPLLAPGVEPDILKGPIAGYHALRCDLEDDLHQLVEQISMRLGVQREPTQSYTEFIKTLSTWAGRDQNP